MKIILPLAILIGRFILAGMLFALVGYMIINNIDYWGVPLLFGVYLGYVNGWEIEK